MIKKLVGLQTASVLKANLQVWFVFKRIKINLFFTKI
jgi:hypothetical protein